MKHSLIWLLLFGNLLALRAQQQDINAAFFDRIDGLLKKYVSDDRIAYQAIGQDKEFAELIQIIGSASLDGKDSATRQAFLINSYNLLVIKGVLEAYPLKSVLDVDGFFDTKKHKVAGEYITLNELEKKKLLRVYEEPRFHFVLVCGAIGCPPIAAFAYTPEKLEMQLEERTRKALNDQLFIKVNDSKKQVLLSQIFEWYLSDFGGSKTSAIGYVNRYRDNPIPTSYKIDYYAYDWGLNKTSSTNDMAK